MTSPAEPPAKRKTRKGVPAEQKGTKAAGYLHGYILLQVVRSHVAHPAISATTIAALDQHLKPNFLADLQNALHAASGSDRAAVKMAADLHQEAAEQATKGSLIATDIPKVKDTFLIMNFSLLLASGLESWVPNVFSPPDSLYNQAHGLVYVENFCFVASSFAYIFGPGPVFIGFEVESQIRPKKKSVRTFDVPPASKFVRILRPTSLVTQICPNFASDLEK
ncbi:hypothetical protein C8R45DRAFT_924067 [Mycena sanguinolenta]|nr:hypothetical protein C8R45DRAFT_924067 [Mycena sanguinolenta]